MIKVLLHSQVWCKTVWPWRWKLNSTNRHKIYFTENDPTSEFAWRTSITQTSDIHVSNNTTCSHSLAACFSNSSKVRWPLDLLAFICFADPPDSALHDAPGKESFRFICPPDMTNCRAAAKPVSSDVTEDMKYWWIWKFNLIAQRSVARECKPPSWQKTLTYYPTDWHGKFTWNRILPWHAIRVRPCKPFGPLATFVSACAISRFSTVLKPVPNCNSRSCLLGSIMLLWVLRYSHDLTFFTNWRRLRKKKNRDFQSSCSRTVNRIWHDCNPWDNHRMQWIQLMMKKMFISL